MDAFSLHLSRVKLLFILLLLNILSVKAQIPSHIITGQVYDQYSGKPLMATVSILRSDSSVIASIQATLENLYGLQEVASYKFDSDLPDKGRYIIKATMDGYEDTYQNIEIKSNRSLQLRVPNINMKRMMYKELGEVVVKATKIKMVMRGDTVVYNADAFNLSQGSMLDALIARLPGAKLTPEGEIFVNGKKIESLLLDGRNFFQGNVKSALQNLPAYTVSKIKVYDKGSLQSVVTGRRDRRTETYVMDVNLKKKYYHTFFGNVEAGLGSNNRFKFKALTLANSSKHTLFAFANVNNLSDNQLGSVGNNMITMWVKPDDTPNGLFTNRIGSITYMRKFKTGMENQFFSQNILKHNGIDDQMLENTEVYLPSGNLFRVNNASMQAKTTGFSSVNSFTYAKPQKYSVYGSFNLNLDRNENYGAGSNTNSSPTSLLSQLLEYSVRTSNRQSVSFSHGYQIHCFSADALSFGIGADYDHLKGEDFSLRDLQCLDGTTPRNYRDNYHYKANHSWQVRGNVDYNMHFRGVNIVPRYDYNYKFTKTNNELYRLDKASGYDSLHFNMLPSTRQALANVIDQSNTYFYREYRNEHAFSVFLGYYPSELHRKSIFSSIYINPKIRTAYDNLYYNRMGRQIISRHAVFFEPEMGFYIDKQLQVGFNASVRSELPALVNMASYRDDTDPLNIETGNASLKNIHTYNASLDLKWHGKYQRLWGLYVDYTKIDNALAYATEYNSGTGVATLRPVSVNGNWGNNITFTYTQALDSARRWTIDNELYTHYNHNVDMATSDAYASSVRSIVNNWELGDNLKLSFRPSDRYDFTLHGGAVHYWVNSKREGFGRIHAGDYEAGLNASASLPWRLKLSTDITMFLRRGYQESKMNSTEWVWNAELQRAFFHDAILVKLTGFDLLHQLSNTKYAMNEQGRTVTWHNSVPHYVMFSLTWRFSVVPKK